MDPTMNNIFEKPVNTWQVDSEEKVLLRPVHEVGIQQQESPVYDPEKGSSTQWSSKSDSSPFLSHLFLWMD